MIDDLLKNKRIKKFLIEYPKEEWATCIEALLVLSISRLSKKYPFGLKTDQLCTIANIGTPQRGHHSSKTGSSYSKRSHSNQGPAAVHKPKISASPPLPFKPTSPAGKALFRAVDLARPTSETLRIPESSKLKEPSTRPIQDASLLMGQIKPSLSASGFWNKPNLSLPNSTEVMKIAEDFLANPFTSQIAKIPNSRNNLY